MPHKESGKSKGSRMRILNLEGTYFVKQFRELGHEVLALGYLGSQLDVVLTQPLYYRGLLELLDARGFVPDLVFWNDNGRTPRIFGFEALPCVTLGYSIDQYCNPWHVPYSAAFDAILVAQRDYLPLFHDKSLARPARWLPLFCKPDEDRDPGLERDIPICFVGTPSHPQNPLRWPFLQEFRRHAPLLLKRGAYAPLFGRSRIVLNQSAAAEVNFRTFEAAGCGAAVLTETVGNGLEELFVPGEEILPPYPRGDAKTAAAIALDWLARPEDLARVAAAGHAAAHGRHTVGRRAAEILALASELAGQSRQRLERPELIRLFLAVCFGFIAGEQQNRLQPEIIRLYGLLAKNYEQRWDAL